MKQERKQYESRAEKQKDFFIGVGYFIGLNVGLNCLLPIMSFPIMRMLGLEARFDEGLEP